VILLLHFLQQLKVSDWANLFINTCILFLEHLPTPRESTSIEDTQPPDMPLPAAFNDTHQSIKENSLLFLLR
jgi:hypothetical protein